MKGDLDDESLVHLTHRRRKARIAIDFEEQAVLATIFEDTSAVPLDDAPQASGATLIFCFTTFSSYYNHQNQRSDRPMHQAKLYSSPPCQS